MILHEEKSQSDDTPWVSYSDDCPNLKDRLVAQVRDACWFNRNGGRFTRAVTRSLSPSHEVHGECADSAFHMREILTPALSL